MLRTMVSATFLMLASQSLTAGEDTTGQSLEAYRITVSYKTESKSDTGSGSSSGRSSYIERVLQDGPDGIVREYDVFLEPGQERHLSDWQYPFRVRQSGSDAELLNRDAMIARRNAWLAAAEIPMESCGRHVFTWNVFRIECDPDHVLELLETVQIQPTGGPEGAKVSLSLAEDPFVFALSETDGDMQRYLATQSLDAESVRKEAAESAMVVAEIMGEELTEAQAIAQANEMLIEGKVTVTLEGKIDGPISRQIIVVVKTVTDADGGTEISTNTQTVERELIS